MSAKGSTFSLSEEAKKKISRARKRKMRLQGFLNTPDTRKKISEAHQGKTLTPEHRAKISAAHKGRRPKNFEECLAKAHATPRARGEDAPAWKGDGVGYGALHAWIGKRLGKPSKCEQCGDEGGRSRRYCWHNRSGEYRRDPSDWSRLCWPCHLKEHPRTVWNKGKKTGLVPRSAIKKGEHRSEATEFKFGHGAFLKKKRCKLCGKWFQPKRTIQGYCGRSCSGKANRALRGS